MAGQKILIIDDDDSIRSLMEKNLVKMGYDVLIAGNGLQGSQYIKSQKDIALVICDVSMPGKGGLDLLSEVREGSVNKTVPFVMITSYPDKNKVVRAAKMGVVSYIMKPFKFDALKDVIEDTIGSPQSNAV